MDLGGEGTVTVERCLGLGGMGEVYAGTKVMAKGCRQRVALKRIRRDVPVREGHRLVDEARVLAYISHPNVARLLGFARVKRDYFIVMEYVEGKSLRELFKLAKEKRRSLSTPMVLWLLAEVADALYAVHRTRTPDGQPLHIVHRDVTPDNIIVDTNGCPRLVDFGVAFSALEDRYQTGKSSTTWLGKLMYLAPEQARFAQVDGRTDLFALGCILVEGLTGEPPFGNIADIGTANRILQVTPEWVDEVTKGLPEPVRAVCHRLLALAPAQRYASGREAAEALRACLEGPYGQGQVEDEVVRLVGLPDPDDPDAQMPPISPPPEPARRPSRAAVGVAAAVLLVAGTGTAGWWWRASRGPPSASPPGAGVAPLSHVNSLDLPQQGEETVNECSKAIMSGVLAAVLAACHGGIKAGTCQEPTSKSVPGAYQRLSRVGMVQVSPVPGLAWLNPRDCYDGYDCPPVQGPVMLEVHVSRHDWANWKLSGNAHIVWGKETVTWGGKRIEAVGRWMVLLTELRESDWGSQLKDQKWPVCATLIGQDGKEGIPLLTPTLLAYWDDSFVQLLY